MRTQTLSLMGTHTHTHSLSPYISYSSVSCIWHTFIFIFWRLLQSSYFVPKNMFLRSISRYSYLVGRYAHTQTRVYTNTFIPRYTNTSIYKHKYIQTHAYTQTRAYTNTRIHKHKYIQAHVCLFLTLCRTNSHSLMFCHNLIRDHLSAYALSLSLSKPSCHFLSHRDGSSNQMETLQAKAPTYLPQFLKTKLSSEQIRCLEEVIQSQKVTN